MHLTNQERLTLGLDPLSETWEPVELTSSRYMEYTTTALFDGNRIRKMIQTGPKHYLECSLDETTSDDRQYILPKTNRGKPQKLSSSVLEKRTQHGMVLQLIRGYLDLYNADSQKTFIASSNPDELGLTGTIESSGDLKKWVEKWHRESTQKDIAFIQNFASEKKVLHTFREGDFFRYRCGRNQYLYGRLLFNIDHLRKQKIEFWDCIMMKPLLIKFYHILTEDRLISIERLRHLNALPSQYIADNKFLYGDIECIGNIPLEDSELDFPIHFGTIERKDFDESCGSILQYKSIGSQNGLNDEYGIIESMDAKTFFALKQEENKSTSRSQKKRYSGDVYCFQNGMTYHSYFPVLYVPWLRQYNCNGIGFDRDFSLTTLRKCIDSNSNLPYWEDTHYGRMGDLRNPKLKSVLMNICHTFNIDISKLVYKKTTYSPNESEISGDKS